MIPNLRGWRRFLSGERITLVHPEGELAGAIRYREHAGPLARMSVILAELAARTPPLADARIGPIERGVTEEGEHTAHVVIHGLLNGGQVQRDVGVVFGDFDHALLTGVSMVPARFTELSAHVRHLLAKDSHGRGLRRRRYVHRGPAGWQGLARGLTTEWQPPDYPANPTLIHVLPAHPVDEPPETVLAQLRADDQDAGIAEESVAAAEPVITPGGLGGVSWDMVVRLSGGTRLHRVLVVLKDARHLYVVRLETLRDERRAAHLALLEVIGSIEPVPAGSRVGARTITPLSSMWAD